MYLSVIMFSLSCFSNSEKGKIASGKIVVVRGETFAANERSSFGSLQKVSIATIQWENILETVNSETTNWYTRSYNGAFSLSFIGTIMNS